VQLERDVDKSLEELDELGKRADRLIDEGRKTIDM